MGRYDLRPAQMLLGYEPRDRWPDGLDLDDPGGSAACPRCFSTGVQRGVGQHRGLPVVQVEAP
jgi:hypothetical protein